MNIETANIRAHKAVIEEDVGLKLITIPKRTGNITYELRDAENKYIKESRHLKTMLVFISMYFGYSYSLLEENIQRERLRLIKENQDVLKSAQLDSEVRVNREKLKIKSKAVNKIGCPHCKYHKSIIKNKNPEGYFIQYQCKNCLKTHIRDPQGKVIKGDRKNIVRKIIKESVDLDNVNMILRDRNIKY